MSTAVQSAAPTRPTATAAAPLIATLTNDHWVSKGYQRGFATPDRRVAVLDVSTGRIIDRSRASRRNFAEKGFTTFVDNGAVVDAFEKAFASVEGTVIKQIREVSAQQRSPDQHAAVANLFAIHLVRSPAFKAFHQRIEAGYRAECTTGVVSNETFEARFEAERGRPPRPGELLQMAHEQYDEISADPNTLAGSMLRQHDQISDRLAQFHMQVVEVDARLPGLVLGDTPIVHAHVPSGRYGFRDSLAILDSTLIIGPLTRHTAACFSVRPQSPVTITTHKVLDALNAVFIRAAMAEVACHPADALRLQQVAQRLDQLPPEIVLERQRR